MSKSTAIEGYGDGETSANEAARIAGVRVEEWLEIAREEGLTYQLSVEDTENDAEAAQKL